MSGGAKRHRLNVRTEPRDPDTDTVRVWLTCADCDLIANISVRPASQAEHLVADLVEAHRYVAIGEQP